MKNSFLFTVFLLLLLTTYKFNRHNNSSTNLNIKEIVIENNSIIKTKDLKKDLSYLYRENVFNLDIEKIKKKLDEQLFIKGYEIKKIYPNTLKIKVFEKTPIAIIQDKKNKYFFTNNKDVIDFRNIEIFNNLPIAFSNKKNFSIFYSNLLKVEFPINDIKQFNFFEINRWDIITKDNKTVKLPVENYLESLKNYMVLKNKSSFKKFNTFDYRISDQLILK